MTVTLTRSIPSQIIAGDSIDFYVAIPSDLSGFTGSARLVCQTSTTTGTMDGTVTTENSDYHVVFSGQSTPGTKTLTAGQYLLSVWATSGNDRYTVLSQALTITPDLSTGTPALIHAQKTLIAIESAIYSRITGGEIEEYSIDGTSVRKMSMDELQRMRSRYTAEVARLQNPNQVIGSVKFSLGPTSSAPDMRYRYGR